MSRLKRGSTDDYAKVAYFGVDWGVSPSMLIVDDPCEIRKFTPEDKRRMQNTWYASQYHQAPGNDDKLDAVRFTLKQDDKTVRVGDREVRDVKTRVHASGGLPPSTYDSLVEKVKAGIKEAIDRKFAVGTARV